MTAPLAQISIALSRLSSSEIQAFLQEILTKDEVETLALRWRLLLLLGEGLPQRAIAEKLGISLCKITRGSRLLKDEQSITRKIISCASRRK